MELLNEVFNNDRKFVDRFKNESASAVDVIIPIIHTTTLWKANLESIYREIPVNRLIISDGGCIDNSLEVVKSFPRVTILDHRDYKSLGFCIRKLIEAVETEHFVYLHSDVYLTSGWYDSMLKYKNDFDWYESSQISTFLVEIPFDYRGYERPLSGGQIGKKSAFNKVLPTIEDDYLYRNEDIIFSELIKRSGGKYGRAEGALLYHQIMNKTSAWRRTINKLEIGVDKSPEEELREWNTQVRGLIKYLPPNEYNTKAVTVALRRLIQLKAVNRNELENWITKTEYGEQWLLALHRHFSYTTRVWDQFKFFVRVTRDRLGPIYQEFKNLVKIVIGWDRPPKF